MEVAAGKRASGEQEAGSGLKHNTGMSISENTLAGIGFGDTAPGLQEAELPEACKVEPRLVSADNTTANTEDNKTPGSWWGRLVEETVAAFVQVAEGLVVACNS